MDFEKYSSAFFFPYSATAENAISYFGQISYQQLILNMSVVEHVSIHSNDLNGHRRSCSFQITLFSGQCTHISVVLYVKIIFIQPPKPEQIISIVRKS